MLEIALRNEHQHRQLRHSSGALTLARTGSDPALWRTVEEAVDRPEGEVVELSFEKGSVAVAVVKGDIASATPSEIGAPETERRSLPVRFVLGDTWLEIVESAEGGSLRPLERLKASLEAEGSFGDGLGQLGAMAPETVARWFGILGSLHLWSESLQQLFNHAARSAVESIGLDGAIVLRRRGDEWDIAASHLPRPDLGICYDPRFLDLLMATPETLYHGAGEELAQSGGPDVASPAVVLAPFRDASGKLVGALYGYRSLRDGNRRQGIRMLEAQLIDLLAGAVSDGINRLEQEAAIQRRAALLNHPVANDGGSTKAALREQRETTLLFADLCDFTHLAAELDTGQVFELLSQVMDGLTGAILEYDGLVVDYYGDGLSAMWNAPIDQSDHAELACRAALRMQERFREVAADWDGWLGQKLRLGVGIHTGNVQLGNAGSVHRPKYGPRGLNVNLAHRIEAATRRIGLRLIVSEVVANRLSNRFTSFRICRAQLTGIHRPLNLYGIIPAKSQAKVLEGIAHYAEGLRLFESGRFEQALFELGKVPPEANLPAEFLSDEIERFTIESPGRRCGDDKHAAASGVIKLGAK